MRTRRPAAVLALGLIAGLALTGCRNSPAVAAYVGEDTVTVDELDAAVQERLADPALAAAVGDDTVGYTRQVLGELINREVLDVAAQRYDVAVDDGEVRARLAELLGGRDEDEALAALAEQGVGRADLLANLRVQLVLEEVAVAAETSGAVDEAALGDAYDRLRASGEARPLGVVTAPDQASADAVAEALRADPGAYADLAAQYPGPTTLSDVQDIGPGQLPPELAAALATAPAGSVTVQPVEGFGGVVVLFVPPLETVRPQLLRQLRTQLQQSAAPLVQELVGDLDITVNPRYGTYDQGGVVAPEGGVVQLLEEPADTGPAAGGVPAGSDAAGTAGD
ncbi:SurA N-terminal domain-containing protein [Blastococcus sp. SYSU D00695]